MHDGSRSLARSGALDAAWHTGAGNHPRGCSARSTPPADVLGISRRATTATWRSAGTPTTQPCETLTCCQNSVGKASCPRGFVVGASGACSSISCTSITRAPPSPQESQCHHSLSTTTATLAGREGQKTQARINQRVAAAREGAGAGNVPGNLPSSGARTGKNAYLRRLNPYGWGGLPCGWRAYYAVLALCVTELAADSTCSSGCGFDGTGPWCRWRFCSTPRWDPILDLGRRSRAA